MVFGHSQGDAWRTEVLNRLGEMDTHLERVARDAQRPSGRSGSPELAAFAKFPSRNFNYLEELEQVDGDQPVSGEELLDEIAGFFRGAQRPDSPYCLFNMNVLPTVDATAAASLALMRNVNGLMDTFSGESLLVEQKVARIVGRWAGWPRAMGIACNGGKITMQYALRAAISRAQPSSIRQGIEGRLVVLCSAGAHYSVEHVAASVGIGAENCIRISLDASGGMDQQELLAAMETAHAEGATIAAVICCGGTIVDFCCDDTAKVWRVVEGFARAHSLQRAPYLHFDSVIGWLYLAFRGASEDEWEAAAVEPEIRSRIGEVVRRCNGLERFDSLGVDFHKTGLCPYTSSFFIAPDRRFMDELGTGDYSYGERDFEFGNFRAYRYTFENSRPTQGILSAWVNLRRLGRQGLREYLVSLHRGRRGVERAIRRHGQFTVLNQSNLGWEVLFDIPFGSAETGGGDGLAIAFMEHCWRQVREGYELPLFSIVPEYHFEHDATQSRVAFLLYPMGDQQPGWWDSVVASIAGELTAFCEAAKTDADLRPPTWEKPIR
jgi:glutamate/tyrosine decarboxylase-like PLP-dependent enzyme